MQAKQSPTKMAEIIEVAWSTIYRELQRNKGKRNYHPSTSFRMALSKDWSAFDVFNCKFSLSSSFNFWAWWYQSTIFFALVIVDLFTNFNGFTSLGNRLSLAVKHFYIPQLNHTFFRRMMSFVAICVSVLSSCSCSYSYYHCN